MDRNHEWWNVSEDPVPDLDDDDRSVTESNREIVREMIMVSIIVISALIVALFVVHMRLRGSSATSTTIETVVQK